MVPVLMEADRAVRDFLWQLFFCGDIKKDQVNKGLRLVKILHLHLNMKVYNIILCEYLCISG